MNYFLSPSNLWIPEKYISINEKDISFVQTRVSTRGTGNSGAVVVYTRDSFISLPFIIPTTGTPQIIRPLITEDFCRMMKKCSSNYKSVMILASLLLFMNSCEQKIT